MNNPSSNLIKPSSIRLRLEAGELFEFPCVDNLNKFPYFFRTSSDHKYNFNCEFDEPPLYAMYKRHKNIFFLIGAWEDGENIPPEVMKIIKKTDELSYLLKN